MERGSGIVNEFQQVPVIENISDAIVNTGNFNYCVIVATTAFTFYNLSVKTIIDLIVCTLLPMYQII